MASVHLPASLERAVPRRRREFVVGRCCARRAVDAILPGFTGEIGMSPERDPCWPTGVIGSITHADGFASAAAAPATLARGIGIDTEMMLTATTMPSVREVAVTAADAAPAGLGLPDELYYTIVFSAKESVFKCLFPIVRRMFFFEDVAVAVVPASASFRATLLIDLDEEELRAGFTLEGRYLVGEPWVHTGIVLERAATEKCP